MADMDEDKQRIYWRKLLLAKKIELLELAREQILNKPTAPEGKVSLKTISIWCLHVLFAAVGLRNLWLTVKYPFELGADQISQGMSKLYLFPAFIITLLPVILPLACGLCFLGNFAMLWRYRSKTRRVLGVLLAFLGQNFLPGVILMIWGLIVCLLIPYILSLFGLRVMP
jgi:hypothetical protein